MTKGIGAAVVAVQEIARWSGGWPIKEQHMTNPMTNTERVALLSCLYDATLEQIERANAAVDANLINGVPRWGSAQGYACALTAIMQSDARSLSMTGEGWQPIETAPKDGDDILVEWFEGGSMLVVSWDEKQERWAALDGLSYHPEAFKAWRSLPEPTAIQEQSKCGEVVAVELPDEALAELHAATRPLSMTGEMVEEKAKDRADWLLDAVATATQDRRFLRGDPAYDEVAGEAILLNAEKAIVSAIAAIQEQSK